MTSAPREIVRLHDAFARWYRGEPSMGFGEIEGSLAADFTFIGPDGRVVDRGELLRGIRDAHGSNPVTIWIEGATVEWEGDGAVLATYEERQEREGVTTTRLSTVLFTIDDSAPGGLLWRHVHETWIDAVG